METIPTSSYTEKDTDSKQQGRLAVVVIHGIGEQLPMDTLTGFAEAVLPEPENDGESKYWSKPNAFARLYEVRRLTARHGPNRPTTDFFEYYWAHHLQDTTYSHVLPWLRRLLLRFPTTLIPKVHGVWMLPWITGVLALGAIALINLPPENLSSGIQEGIKQWGGLATLGLAVAPFPLVLLGEWLLLGYLGDSARYLHASPANVGVRQKIRAEGVEFLRKLHESGRYTEIIVVGHSLGSVIGYDILTYLWKYYRPVVNGHETSLLKDVEAAASALENSRSLYWKAPKAHEDLVQAFAEAQENLFEKIQFNADEDKDDSRWLVSRFVTLGSPLAHAQYLLAHDGDDLKRRQLNREMPTCPPVYEPGSGFGYRVKDEPGVSHPRKLHQAAPFACTRWINLYFQPDLIGDPLIDTFGPGIENVKLPETGVPFGKRLLFSHVWYWRTRGTRKSGLPYSGSRTTTDHAATSPASGSPTTGPPASSSTDVPHIHALRVALGFESTPEPEPMVSGDVGTMGTSVPV